jgi:hypothetical protein
MSPASVMFPVGVRQGRSRASIKAPLAEPDTPTRVHALPATPSPPHFALQATTLPHPVMRFAALIPLVTLSGLAAAAPAHLNRPVKHLPDAIAKAAVHAGALARLQHHPKRALLDVCATLDARVLAGAGLGGLLGAALGARADLCLCVSAFPLNVEAVLGVGINTLTNLLGLHSAANIDAALLALVRLHLRVPSTRR